ncbi:hypothetical protein F4X90_21760 [Candidatus Poribacteria bacterium]|nr:hypothetical protein [Candidatus Poribacteria bacterium]
MFLRKYWIPLSVFLVLIVGIGLYMLAIQPPKDPIVIYKPVEPLPKSPVAEAPVGDTSQGGHFHADGTWHAEPHTENPTRGKPMTIEETVAQYEQLKKRHASLTQQKEKLLKELSAGEVRTSMDKILTQGNAIIDTFPDVIQMTPEKYLALSTHEKEKFLQRADKYDVEVEALYDIVSESPQELQDELETLKPEAMHRMRLASSISLSDFYRSLEQK